MAVPLTSALNSIIAAVSGIKELTVDFDTSLFAYHGVDLESIKVNHYRHVSYKDRFILIAWYVQRGTTWSNKAKSTSPTGYEQFTKITTAHNIQERDETKKLLTLARIAAIDPFMVALVKKFVSLKDGYTSDYRCELPYYYQFPSALSILPKSLEPDYDIWLDMFSERINSENKQDKAQSENIKRIQRSQRTDKLDDINNFYKALETELDNEEIVNSVIVIMKNHSIDFVSKKKK